MTQEEELAALTDAYLNLRRAVNEALKLLGDVPDSNGILAAVILLNRAMGNNPTKRTEA